MGLHTKMDEIRTLDVPCNLCGSRDSTFLFSARDRLHGVGGTFTYVQCKQCGLVYMNPQVIPEDTGRLYPQDYAPHSVARRRSRLGARALYCRILKIPVLGHCLRSITNVRIMAPVCRTLNARSRVLDIGCGTGAFLNSIKIDKGCEVYGVDISDAAVRGAKESFGLDIFEGTITQAPFPGEYFDVITAWWYLEHVHNPNEAVAKMSAVLKKDGHCIIGVPNSKSLFARIFKDKWYHLDCPRHLCIWSTDTIARLLAQHGLSITKVIYDKTPWGLLGSLQYLFYSDNIDPKRRDWLRRSRLLWVLLLPWTVLISLVRKSDIIVVYAKKHGMQYDSCRTSSG